MAGPEDTGLGSGGGPPEERWLGTGAQPELCRRCWEAARCPRQFAYPPAQHETLLGRLPLASRLAQQVLQQVRPWIEPAQSFEKNQLGLGDVFVNSLRFTWTMALLADAAVLLRARALLGRPPRRLRLVDLMPSQLSLELGAETPGAILTQAKCKLTKPPMKSRFHTLAFATPSETRGPKSENPEWLDTMGCGSAGFGVRSSAFGFFLAFGPRGLGLE